MVKLLNSAYLGASTPDDYGQATGVIELLPFELYLGAAVPSGRRYIDVILSGVSPLTLEKAISLNYLKLFGGTEQRNLPSGYTQVEYLESSGTQYIDTGIADVVNAEFGLEAQLTGSVTTGFPTLLGAARTSYDYKVVFGCASNLNKFYTQCSSGSNYNVSDVTLDTNKHKFKLVNTTDSQTLTIDNTTTLGNYALTTDTGASLFLFARNAGDTVSSFINAKIYSCYTKLNGVLVQNLIPCKRNSDNVLGMYDTVTGTFLTNAGTGDFTAGADVVVPSPTTPIDIVCNNGVVKVSKNLFDYVNFYANYVTITESTVGRLAIRLIPNTQYTLSTNTQSSPTSAQIWVVSGNDTNFTPNTSVNGVLIDTPRTVTSDNNGYICLGIRVEASGTIIPLTEQDFINGTVWLQIEEGASATTYMPYGQIYIDGTTETVEINTTGDTATAEMLLKVDTYQDVQSVLDGSVTRNVGIKVLDGTEDWVASSTYLGSCYCLNFLSGINLSQLYCTHFLPVNNSSNYGRYKCFISGTGKDLNLWYSNNKTTAVADLKQFLASQYANGTPVIVIYPLAQSVVEQVAPQALNVQTGDNILEITQASLSGLTMEVSYRKKA